MVAATLPKTRRIELILRQVDQLPTLPAVATRLLQLTADQESRSQEVIDLVASDPALTAKVLAACRKADRGVRNGDTITVERAVLLLGYGQVRNLVLSAKVFELFDQAPTANPVLAEEDGEEPAEQLTEDANPRFTNPGGTHFDRPGFWAHCLGVAAAAERIAAAANDKELPKDEAFVCGLLHDLGKLALAWVLPKAYDRVAELAELHQDNIAEHERKLIGVDHHTAGKRLAEQWKLPHRLQDTLWLHGSPFDTLPKLPHRRMIGLVQLADAVVRQRHLGYSGNHTHNVDLAVLAGKLGIDYEVVEQATEGLFEDVEARAQALGLNEQVSVDLYLKSVQRANEALGSANAALERKARSATAQARVLGAIADFHGQATPGSSVQDVIDAVASSARHLLGAGFFAVIHPTRHAPDTPLNPLTESATLGAGSDAEAFDQQLVGDGSTNDESVSDPESGGESSAGEGGGGESWLICQYDAEANPLRARYVECPPQAPNLKDLDPRRGADMTLMGVLPWIADYLLEADDLRKVSLLPLPSGWGTSAVLLHDRGELPAWDALLPLVSAWGTAIAAANQHDGARRLGEQLAEANTALAEAQDELTRAQSMARLGEMAAGAAHEMNNPLAIIAGRSQLLTMSLDGGSKAHQAATAIFRESHRLSDLITALRMFADPPRADRQPTNLATLLPDVVNKVGAAAKRRREDLEFSVVLPGEFPEVSVDPAQIDRAVTELLMNAVQAEPQRGVVVKARIDSHDLPDDQPVGDNTATGTLIIQVIDDGVGMDEHTLAHATDPFFSAKPAGRQVGMGLSRVAQLAEAHGGRIDLRSTPGRGTTATLTLALP